MENVIAAALILLGLRHEAPAVYHAPVKTLPLVIEHDPAVIQTWNWGPQCSR